MGDEVSCNLCWFVSLTFGICLYWAMEEGGVENRGLIPFPGIAGKAARQ